MRLDATTQALFLATGTNASSGIAICKDPFNPAGIGGCVFASAGGLLSQPFDMFKKDDTLWSERAELAGRVGGLSGRDECALPAQRAG